MPDDILARAEQAIEGVTVGPWMPRTSEVTADDRAGYRFGPRDRPAAFFGHQMRRADAAFIAAARELVPELAAALREARAEVRDLHAGIAAQDAALTAQINEAVRWGRERKTERDEARVAIARVRALVNGGQTVGWIERDGDIAWIAAEAIRHALDGEP